MKTIIAAVALMFALSANAGMASADDGERKGYEQHESKNDGDKDRHERGDKDKDRGDRYAADRNGAGGHRGSATEPSSRFWDWLPF